MTVLKCYLQKTLDIRGMTTKLLLMHRAPHHGASRDSIRRWTRDVLREAGIDISVFNPHSTRAGSTSKATTKLPLETILKTAGWSRDSTFRKYYKKIQKDEEFADAVLD